ncbi:unknown protein [Microcystis aeruginosa NIES-843]|uniref:Uncharacterized protein n=1 Tax=Microcystis aeruginosa (strain NIES-843 / IAM M-2473) TaxID=449447 RepID=B0JPF3_MICAN|nr:unknown protein [Microcystis aeruginosa NIES-843]
MAKLTITKIESRIPGTSKPANNPNSVSVIGKYAQNSITSHSNPLFRPPQQSLRKI